MIKTCNKISRKCIHYILSTMLFFSTNGHLIISVHKHVAMHHQMITKSASHLVLSQRPLEVKISVYLNFFPNCHY